MSGVQETWRRRSRFPCPNKQHDKFVKALEKLFAEVKQGVSKGEVYTFCLLTCPGRVHIDSKC